MNAGCGGHVAHHTLPSIDLLARPPLWPVFRASLSSLIFLFDFNPGVC